jgi:hypothetical protein
MTDNKWLHEDHQDKKLLSTTKTEDKVKSRLLLNVVIGESTTILKLLPCENKALLIGRDTLLILDLCFNVVNRVRGFNLQRNGLSSESLDKDLHTATETQNKMESGLFLNIVVRESAAVLQLLAGEDKALLIRRNSFLVLDFRLHVVNRIRRFYFEGDRFASEGFHENLHSTPETEDEVESRLLLDVVIRKGTTILQLLASEDQTLLIRRDAAMESDETAKQPPTTPTLLCLVSWP